MTADRNHEETIEHAVCAGCGCLCDDVRIRFSGGRAAGMSRACAEGERWARSLEPLDGEARVGGKPASVEDAIRAAREALAAARAPAVLAGPSLTVEAAREAVLLAASIPSPIIAWPPPPRALERQGLHAPEITATLGEVRGTADLVIFWRADPVRTHPRHLERYSLDPPLLSGGRRAAVIVDAAGSENLTSPRAAEVIELPAAGPGALAADLELARELRISLERREDRRGSPGGDGARRLAARIEASHHAHFFLGGAALDPPALLEELQLLAAHVREDHRITISCLPPPGNARGVLEALAWLTGFAGGSILPPPALLEGTDVLVALGIEPPLPGVPPGARRIAVGTGPDAGAEVWIRVPGLDPRLPSTVFRSDGIPLALDGRRADSGERMRAPAILDPAVDVIRNLHVPPPSSGRRP